jgi:hypothetical protein
MKKYIPFLLLIASIIFVGCSSKETSESSNQENGEAGKISKGATAIWGSIVSIDTTKLSSDKHSPCSKVPCWAEVKIEKVLGVGQGGPIVSVGDTLSVNFKFTLSETTPELIPNLDKRMPGLNINDKFEADLQNLIITDSSKVYSVYYYNKI